ncbi:MAG TPA: cbb3-type cytochrome c oxidase subunit 3 [Burkholderiales bacterium]|jgi:cytochrome c oxidase cbb3-type subunit 4|nr:cbb3-type cytochrome c oxidase subunit 3 [Burkholderiales bacterium]
MELLTILRSTVTVIAFATFVAIVLWAYSARRSSAFEAAAHAPLRDEIDAGSPSPETTPDRGSPR